MKVSEAKTKVCPFIQNGLLLAASIVPTNNNDMEAFRIKTNSANINCICGDCMAWQYTEVGVLTRNTIETDRKTEYGYCKRIENES